MTRFSMIVESSFTPMKMTGIGDVADVSDLRRMVDLRVEVEEVGRLEFSSPSANRRRLRCVGWWRWGVGVESDPYPTSTGPEMIAAS